VAIQDISRSIFDPRKAYTGVRMQQGRVLLDDDWNDAGDISADDLRRARVHVIGAAGSPDAGFKVVGPLSGSATTLDFGLEAGTLYLGGLRLERAAPGRYLRQGDWLRGPTPAPAAPVDGRRDLVWVEAWEQPVSAVEDGEIREPALGGPDTTTRLRVMHRIRVATGVGGSPCQGAWEGVTAAMAAAGAGVLDDTAELTSDATLTVTYVPTAPPADLCSPAVAGGYLGAENQALRIQLVDAGHLTWGHDNASPLYRARLAADGTTVTLDTQPRDQAHWPTAGQVVELLPWGAVLPNGEKVAEISGHLSRVASSYDPDSRQLTLQTAAPAPAAPAGAIYGEEWRARPDAAALEGAGAYVYLRVWNRGSDRASAPAVPFAPGTAVTLGTTGIAVTVTGTHRRPGDHWIVAARPHTPTQVLPWSLEHGRPAHGIRRWAAPLGIIEWSGNGAAATGTVVEDCRHIFLPLTRQRGCCRFRVGDGIRSHGDFTSIQDAIEALPLWGGEVCVLEGTYRERVELDGLTDVVVKGCGGRRSRILPPAGAAGPGVRIRDSVRIRLQGLAVEAPADVGVLVEETGKSGCEEIRLEGLHVLGRDDSCIAVRGAPRHVEITGCTLHTETLAVDLADGSDVGRYPAMYLAADDVMIEDCMINTEPGTAARTAFGGIQIAGMSDRVTVRGCTISGGNGHGITLGSLRLVPEPVLEETDSEAYDQAVADGVEVVVGGYLLVDEGGCIHVGGTPPDDTGGQPGMVPVSEGPIHEIRILDNQITRTGSSGISVVRFFDPRGPYPQMIRVDGIQIDRNRITNCLRLQAMEAPPSLRAVQGHGGICLADASHVSVRDNQIEGNGRSHIDPVCGIFVLRSEGFVATGNRIVDNGPREGDGPILPGQRGGIVLASAHPVSILIETIFSAAGLAHPAGSPAVRIHENEVVQPTGKALRIMGRGTMVVTDNHLTSRGNTVMSFLEQLVRVIVEGVLKNLDENGEEEDDGQEDALDDPTLEEIFLELFSGSAVTILNIGLAREALFVIRAWGLKNAAAFSMGSLGSQMITPSYASQGSAAVGVDAVLAGGLVTFDDNQVVLDLAEREFSLALCSVLLLSLDDVSCHDNQMDCQLAVDFVLANALALGFTCRASGNRFREDIFRTLRSAVTAGIMNMTHHNHGTHCISVLGPDSATADEPNHVFMNLLSPGFCGDDDDGV
jgi:hypothetical protein